MASGRRGGGGGGKGRGRGRISEEQVHQVAAAIRDLATSHGFGCTVSTTSPQWDFIKACEEDDIDLLKTLVDSMDEDDRESLASVRLEGFGPLHQAANMGKLDICKYLVDELGFNVDSDANNHGSGVTPLSCAVLHGKTNAVKYFLDKGADPNKKNYEGSTPLLTAAKEGHNEIARLLLSKGASVAVSSSEGTPLHVAAANGKSDIVEILLEHHADPNKVSADLGPPLASTLCATPERLNESACLKCIKLLVKAGADLNCPIPDTPLVIATSKRLTECVEYLLEVGANANILSNHGARTPIEIAAKSGRKLVEILYPFTSPIQAISNWSIEGIIDYAKSGQSIDQLKLRARKTVEWKDYVGASKLYSEAIKLAPEDATLYSNRSFSRLKSGESQDALQDANVCIKLRPDWPKGYYRKGAALMLLEEYKEACDAYLAGVKLDPANTDMLEAFWEAVKAMKEEHLGEQSDDSSD